MAWNIRDVKLDDLVRPLSAESLEYFQGIELGEGWKADQEVNRFKFVRMGRVIVLGWFIPYFPPKDLFLTLVEPRRNWSMSIYSNI